MNESEFMQASLTQMLNPRGFGRVTAESLLATDGMLYTYEGKDINWGQVYLAALRVDSTLVPFTLSVNPTWRDGKPRTALAFMAQSDRRRLAADPDLDPFHFEVLAMDPDKSVRDAVVQNPNCPFDIRSELRFDEPGWGPLAKPGRDWDPIPDMFYLGMESWVARDVDHAVQLMTVAAKGGHPRAMGQLRYILEEEGRLDVGISLFRSMADLGNADAMYQVALLYVARANKTRAQSDLAQVKQWIAKAANAGSSEAAKMQAGLKESNSSQGGCYIATAVYGSYDSPPVMTLRRYRDETLARSILGRLFIRIYYRLSPPLARHFAAGSALSASVRVVLDAIVRRLEGPRTGA